MLVDPGLEEAAMRRSIGVTVIAVLSLLGSLFVLLMGVCIAVLPFVSSKLGSKDSPFSPGLFKLMMVVGALVYIFPAIWGIATSVGLFRLKEWARISMVVFSVLLILMFGFSALMLLVVPFPTTPNQPVEANVISGVRIFTTCFMAGIVGIGIWWVVFFTRASVKKQFVPIQQPVTGTALEAPLLPPDSLIAASVASAPTRPLSLTIIAWLLLVGSLFAPISLFLRYPAAIFTKVVTGWPATLYYLAIAVVGLYVGIGLLRLKPLARSVGVAYYGLFFVNMAVFYLAPGGRTRMLDLMQRSQSIFPGVQTQPWKDWNATQLFDTRFLAVMACIGLLSILAPIYFLVTRRQAFERAAAAAANRGLGTASPN
jgi:hypothetical protein